MKKVIVYTKADSIVMNEQIKNGHYHGGDTKVHAFDGIKLNIAWTDEKDKCSLLVLWIQMQIQIYKNSCEAKFNMDNREIYQQ